MQNPHASKSVDMTGDLSRISRLTSDAEHRSNVGSPIASAPYRAMYPAGDGDNLSNRHHPLATPVVLVTLAGSSWEYRVALVTASQFAAGLRREDHINRLNTDMTRKCFGRSTVHQKREDAISEAERLVDDATVGIKVLHVHDTWQ